MHRAVASHIARARTFGPDDQPRALVVLGVLAASMLAGLGVTRASLENAPTDAAGAGGEVAPEATHAPEPSPEAPSPRTPEVAATAQPPAAPAPEQPTEPALDVAPAASTATPAPAAGVGTLVRGRIAYIRCDGARQVAGPNPCPRDPPVERAVWTAIERLPSCGALAGERGGADVRVVFDGGSVTGLGFRDIDPPILDREAVRGCLEPALAGLRSSQPSVRMTASFRFDIR